MKLTGGAGELEKHMKPSNEGTVKVERQVRPTARWATCCWSKSGVGHFFDFKSHQDSEDDDRVMEAACGHYRALSSELQPEDQIIKKCARCQRIEAA